MIDAALDRTGLAAVAITALAVACCAGGLLLLALAGSLAVGALISIVAAVTLLLVACATLYLRYRPDPRRSGGRP